MTCCPTEVHEAMKGDRQTYVAKTYSIGWQARRNGWEYEVRNCRACHSTLSDGTERPRALKEAA